ncbi:MAG TPA: hypothetical protein ENN67_08580 [Firmicutes bacterium]|nr:hypothetical protein [Bacillota bacterium]
MLVSCSGTNPLQPGTDLNREVLGYGNGGPGNGQGEPCGPNENAPGPKPPPQFKWSCQRFFEVAYDITLPNGDEIPGTGIIHIFDVNCEAEESQVKVDFYFKFEKPNGQPAKLLRIGHGTKTETEDGTVYAGTKTVTNELPWHKTEIFQEFELLVTPGATEDDPNAISGMFHANIYFWHTYPNGDVKEKENDFYADINGFEIDGPPE